MRHYALKQADSCLLLLFLFSYLFWSVFPKERERSIFTVVVWLSVVAFCQTGNRARFCTVKGEYGVGIASNAENVTADRKGRYGWIGQYDLWHSSRVHSYFPSDHLVPILTGREAGNLPMTAVFHSSSSKHLLLLQHSYSEVKSPNSLNTPNYPSLSNTKLPQVAPNHLSLSTPNSLSFCRPRVLQEAASAKLPQISPNYLSLSVTKLPQFLCPRVLQEAASAKLPQVHRQTTYPLLLPNHHKLQTTTNSKPPEHSLLQDLDREHS